jgi:hypothetical protein
VGGRARRRAAAVEVRVIPDAREVHSVLLVQNRQQLHSAPHQLSDHRFAVAVRALVRVLDLHVVLARLERVNGDRREVLRVRVAAVPLPYGAAAEDQDYGAAERRGGRHVREAGHGARTPDVRRGLEAQVLLLRDPLESER